MRGKLINAVGRNRGTNGAQMDRKLDFFQPDQAFRCRAGSRSLDQKKITRAETT